MLDSIENHPTYRTQLWDLSGYDFFNKSKSGKDNNDRLKLVLRALADAGYIVKRNSESANYIATGKMGYVHTILAWIWQGRVIGAEGIVALLFIRLAFSHTII